MPSEGEGIARVRNQAFRWLADVLDLPGSVDSLSLIDIDHATPVVDLGNMIEAGTVRHMVYCLDQSIGAGSSTTSTLSWWSAGGWTNIVEQRSTTGVVPPSFYEVMILRIGAAGTSTDVDLALASLDSALGATGTVPIFAANEQANLRLCFFQSAGAGGGLAGAYIVPPPIVVTRNLWDQIQLRGENSGGGGESLSWRIEVMAAPPGVFPYR